MSVFAERGAFFWPVIRGDVSEACKRYIRAVQRDRRAVLPRAQMKNNQTGGSEYGAAHPPRGTAVRSASLASEFLVSTGGWRIPGRTCASFAASSDAKSGHKFADGSALRSI